MQLAKENLAAQVKQRTWELAILGTIFKFDVKINLGTSAEIQTPQPTRQVISLAAGQPLVVDDYFESRLFLVKLLTSLGFLVREAANGQEAVDQWNAFAPQLILKLRGVIDCQNSQILCHKTMTKRPQRPPILKSHEFYTFRSYFQMKFAPADILRELGASLTKASINLPPATVQLTRLPDLRQRLEEGILRVSLTSEAARREVLIAPILLEVAHITEATINIEYPIEVNQYLKGELDYYLQSQHNVLVVEAKQADLTKGFTQLSAELIALDSWVESDEPVLYGAVTTGDIWQFGSFQRQERIVTQDLMLYRVPTDLEVLLQILVGILLQPSTNEIKSV